MLCGVLKLSSIVAKQRVNDRDVGAFIVGGERGCFQNASLLLLVQTTHLFLE